MLTPIGNPQKLYLYTSFNISMGTFLKYMLPLTLLSLLLLIATMLAVLTLALVIADRKLFRSVDYFPLLTFVCFFLFIGNTAAAKAPEKAPI